MTDFLLYLQTFSTPVLDNIFLGISALTGEFVYLAVLGIVYWCIDKNRAYYIGIFLLLSFSLNSLLKNLFHIPRPFTYSEVRQIDSDTGYGYSFPSGHAQMSTTFGGMFSLIFRKKWLYIVGTLLIVLTGLSRMYLGVHTPVDILCGIAIGCVLVLAGKYLQKLNPKILAVATFIFMLGVSIIYPEKDILKLLFFAAGFFSGNAIEEKFIGFTVPSKIKMRILGAVIGFSTTILLIIVLKSLGLTYIRYLCMGLFITVAVPAMIKWTEKKWM
ncbi:MAG: phosphatase PAP2 family protein [Clostridia bacterium]|nr:phosphatase PAP2 family protein [Clostridia bacterium]